ncbi:hypothetical protein, partial [Lacticaseibacillus rhamnosus]
GHHDSTCFVLFIHLKASFIVMTNCRLANPHGFKIASRYRTIFGKQLRLLWSKRERFSPGKRSEKSELRTNRPQKWPGRNKRIFRMI